MHTGAIAEEIMLGRERAAGGGEQRPTREEPGDGAFRALRSCAPGEQRLLRLMRAEDSQALLRF